MPFALTDLMTHPVIALLVFLGVLVFVHELGHYLVGRWCGIAVEAFSIGFGPPLLSIRRGLTEYRVSWIPLGGYVKFYGASRQEDVPPAARGQEFYRASIRARVATVAAGPIANFLFAIFAYAAMGWAGIQLPAPVIGDVLEGSPAEKAGILVGDVIESIGGHKVRTWRDIERNVSENPEKALKIQFQRDGVSKEIELVPATVESQNMFGKKVKIGRAGVARGYSLPVLSVTAAGSPAALAGIETGDLVKAIVVREKTYAVESYLKFALHLSTFALAGETTVQLQIAKDAVEAPSVGGPEAAQPKVVNLTLPRPDNADQLAAGSPNQHRRYLAQLGITDAQLTIGEATENAAGLLRRGDRLLAWGDTPLKNIFNFQEKLVSNTAAEADFLIQRGFQEKRVTVSLKPIETQQPGGKVTVYVLPVTMQARQVEPQPVEEKHAGPIAALTFGAIETARQTGALLSGIYHLLIGDVPLKALGGPMMIAKVAGDAAKLGWQTFVGSMALISINLGLINLFPIPVLDGGQLVLFGVEAARRRPLAERAIENFQKVGFVMIMALVVLATYNDFSRFWKSMLESVVGMFQ